MKTSPGSKRPNGTSLILVFLLLPILIFLARSVHWLSSTAGHRTHLHRQKVSAQYILEAGQAHALAKLKQDADWTAGFQDEEMDDISGTYSVIFTPAGAEYQAGTSVNNITGTEAVDGPRGPGTVEPGTVELVVLAGVSGVKLTGETIFEAKTKPLPSYGLGASGNIVLKGDVSIRGIQSLNNQAEVRAGVHSNSEGGLGPTIQWDKNDRTDRMSVKGTVTTSASQSNSIRLQGTEGVDYDVSEIQTDVASLPMPSTNILQTVTQHSSLSPPVFNNFDTTTLGRGESFYDGDASLQGDLVLNGHNLYVDGDLTVNGTIRGDGSVYVTGKTTFKGDAEIEANETGVALYSHGAVELSGFNGLEYLESLKQQDAQLSSAISEYNNSFRRVNLRRGKGGGGHAYEDRRSKHAPGLLESFDRNNLKGETAKFIRSQLEKQATTELKKFDLGKTRGFWGYRLDYRNRDADINRLVVKPPPKADFSKLGQAYFQGLIVSDHYIRTDNAVSVVGSLWSTGQYEAAGGESNGIEPGDIILNNGTEVVMNQELLEEPETATRDVTDLQLKVWLK